MSAMLILYRLECLRIAEFLASDEKSGSRNAIVMSDFRSDIEIWPFRACAMKNMHYYSYYINSSAIMDSAVGQIPHSTERFWCLSLIEDLLYRNELTPEPFI